MDFSSYITKHNCRKNKLLAVHAGESEADAWHTRRLLGIGGSEVAAVLGLDVLGNKTPFDVWRKKTGQDSSSFSNRFTEWGHILEDVVARHFADVTGFAVAKCNKHFSMKSAPWMVGNIDRLIIINGVKSGVLECKTTAFYNDKKFNKEAAWFVNGEFFDENKSGITDKNDIPLNYYLQCQHYMLVTGLHMSYLAVLIGGNDYRIFAVPFSEVDAKFIYNGLSVFWCRYVLDNAPPPPIESDFLQTFFQDDGATIVADTSTVDLCRQYAEINSQIAALNADKEEIKKKLVGAIGSAVSLVLPSGQKIASFKANNNTVVNTAAMSPAELETYSALLKKYTIKQPSENRTLRVNYKENE